MVDIRVENKPQELPHYKEVEKEEKIVHVFRAIAHFLHQIMNAISYAVFPLKYAISCIVAKKPVEAAVRDNIPLQFTTNQKLAMDSKFYYAIEDGRIWFKPIGAEKDAKWKEFGDGTLTNLESVSADGDNVVVMDKERHIHYAKSHSVDVGLSDDSSDWVIKEGSKVSWTTKWFGMDLVAPIVNHFKDPTLDISATARSYAISHKGTDAMYYTDMAGKKHPDPFIGVTTLYMLSEDGTRLFFADPWLHNKFENELTGPEEGTFVAEKMSASASTLFLIQRSIDENGKERNTMYTRYADFDSIGSNPALPATYDEDNKVPLVRYLPAEDWLKQPEIVLEGKACLSNTIFILQTGQGQNHRQLRVLGKDKDGEPCCYYKNIYDREWSCEKIDQPVEISEIPKESPAAQKAFDYKGTLTLPKMDPQPVQLTKFSRVGLNERGLHTTVDYIVNGKTYSFPLYARRGLRHLLGFDGSSKKLYWTMVVPKDYFTDPAIAPFIKSVFNNKKTMSVHVEEHDDRVTIQPEFFSFNKFMFEF